MCTKMYLNIYLINRQNTVQFSTINRTSLYLLLWFLLLIWSSPRRGRRRRRRTRCSGSWCNRTGSQSTPPGPSGRRTSTDPPGTCRTWKLNRSLKKTLARLRSSPRSQKIYLILNLIEIIKNPDPRICVLKHCLRIQKRLAEVCI